VYERHRPQAMGLRGTGRSSTCPPPQRARSSTEVGPELSRSGDQAGTHGDALARANRLLGVASPRSTASSATWRPILAPSRVWLGHVS